MATRPLRPRRVARAVRSRARDRRRAGVRVARLELGARRVAAWHDARRSPPFARADERAVGPQGAVPRRFLLEHRFQWPADPGGYDGSAGARRTAAGQRPDLLLALDRARAACAHELFDRREP